MLEVGCGWGSFAMRAAQRTGCRVTGITVSKEQLAEATARAGAWNVWINAQQFDEEKKAAVWRPCERMTARRRFSAAHGAPDGGGATAATGRLQRSMMAPPA